MYYTSKKETMSNKVETRALQFFAISFFLSESLNGQFCENCTNLPLLKITPLSPIHLTTNHYPSLRSALSYSSNCFKNYIFQNVKSEKLLLSKYVLNKLKDIFPFSISTRNAHSDKRFKYQYMLTVASMLSAISFSQMLLQANSRRGQYKSTMRETPCESTAV